MRRVGRLRRDLEKAPRRRAIRSLTLPLGSIITLHRSPTPFPLLVIILTILSSTASTAGAQVLAQGQQDTSEGDLLGNSVYNASVSAATAPATGVPALLSTTRRPPALCEVARIRCALRAGCGLALQNYMLSCADLMDGRVADCDDFCKNALVALISTEEGHGLMDCICSDDYCRETKMRVEVCREEVMAANARDTVVSCSVAHLICSADTICSTALMYYDKFCKRMFSGRSCSYRCNNSISILQRQEKATKLQTCSCDGSEPFDCDNIKKNMAKLCFHQYDEEEVQREEEETNEVDTLSKPSSGNSTSSCGRHHDSLLGLYIGSGVLYGILASSAVRWRWNG